MSFHNVTTSMMSTESNQQTSMGLTLATLHVCFSHKLGSPAYPAG